MKFCLILLSAFFLATGWVFAEGTVTETITRIGNPNKYVYTWTASTNGIATYSIGYLRGEICKIISKSTSIVSATYNVRLWDSASNDTFYAQGIGLASNSTSVVCPGIPLKDGTTTNVRPSLINDSVHLSVTGIGTNHSGSVTVYIKE